jgi:hypothetical protein
MIDLTVTDRSVFHLGLLPMVSAIGRRSQHL